MTIIQGNFGDKVKSKEKDKKVKKPALMYQLHVSLAFSDPLIWRRILVPGETTLRQLHRILQICLSWSDEHNHQFYVGKIFYEMSSSIGEDKEYDEAKFNLQTLEEAMKWCFTYIYDAGDGWEHDIVLEETKPSPPGEKIPVLMDGEWAAPPEDIGNVHSYGDFLHALWAAQEDKKNTILQGYGLEGFDPELFDLMAINERLKELSASFC